MLHMRVRCVMCLRSPPPLLPSIHTIHTFTHTHTVIPFAGANQEAPCVALLALATVLAAYNACACCSEPYSEVEAPIINKVSTYGGCTGHECADEVCDGGMEASDCLNDCEFVDE